MYITASSWPSSVKLSQTLRGAVQKRLTLLTDMPLKMKMYGFVCRGKLSWNFLTFFVLKNCRFYTRKKKLTFQPQKIRIEFELLMQYNAIIE